MTPEEKQSNDVLIKDLQDTIKELMDWKAEQLLLLEESVIVYDDISREATEYRNEVTQLKSQVEICKNERVNFVVQKSEFQDEIAKLKDELETWKNTVITQHKVFEEQEKQIKQLNSTLDEIKTLAKIDLFVDSDEIKEILAKHEDEK